MEKEASLICNNTQKLWEILGQYKEYMMHTYPEWATYEGDHRFDDLLADYSEEGLNRESESLKYFLKKSNEVNSSYLSEENKINLELFKYELDDLIEGEKFNLNLLPITQLDGLHIDLPQISEIQPLETEKEFSKYILRLKKVPIQFENIIKSMKKGVKNNLVHTKEVCEQIIRQINDIKETVAENTPFILGIRKEYLTKDRLSILKDIIESSIKPAYNELHEFIKNEYLPYARENEGYWSLPDGEKIYSHLIKLHTSTKLSPEEIHQIGLNEVSRIRNEMENVKNKSGFKGTLDEFNEYLKNDPKFYFDNKEDLLKGYREILIKAEEKLPELFGMLPKTPYEVREIEDYRAESSPQAYYYSAPDDKSRPGYFYANTFDLSARPKFTMTALALHEAVPGHHLQIALAQELEGFAWFRKHLEMTAFIEGWALYTESLGHEMGMYEDIYQHYGALTYEMERACRLVIDTGLHYKRWTRDEAINFMKKNTPSADVDIIAEIDRYIVWPGQALSYKLGELKIKELRKIAEESLSTNFNLKEFHDQLLIHGAIPLSMLEEHIHAWINSKK